MRVRNHSLMSAAAASVMSIGLAACGGPTTTSTGIAQPTESLCVAIPEGAYFVVEDGRLLPTSAPRPETIERVVEAPIGWAEALEKSFADRGFPWMNLRARGGVATLTGLAPDQDSKERGFLAGEQAVLTHPTGSEEVDLVVDGIAVEGGDLGVGAGLATLSQGTVSLEACQTAFTDTMQGRNVEFRTSSAVIRTDSARLLDAVTGVAILCKDYAVVIEGHTDARGSDDINMELSEMRANAVRDYLIERGVNSEDISAVGYGETRPIDPSATREAYELNRRTEFNVTPR